MTYYYPRIAVLCCLFFVFFIFSSKINAQSPCQVVGGIITVSNTNDEGNGSLRNAITCANEFPGAQVIQFNIPGNGPHIIYVGSTTAQPLPNLEDNGTVIDGSTQSGFIDDPVIVLDGSQTTWNGPYNALYILGDYCEIYGLTIRYFPDDAIDLNNADHVRIGEAGKGNVIYYNGIYQDIFSGFNGIWNGCGIVVRSGSDSCWIQGNTIGTNFDQNLDAGNEYCGVIVRNFCLDLRIGGPNEGEGNVIANNPTGIRIDNSYNISIRANSMYCNDTIAIELLNNGNFEKLPPTIDIAQVDYISGSAPSGDLVDIFVVDDEGCEDAPCQGKIYLGTAITSNSVWFFPTNTSNYNLQPGDKVTAVATTQDGTSSTFANCRTVISAFACAEPDGTIWVTNTEDDGPGSLRAAINCANDDSGPNVIKFNIPDSTFQYRIFVGSQTGLELPALLDEYTIIDATTQPGFGILDFAPKVVLDGIDNEWDVPINAIWIRADHCEVYGLEIVNFPDDAIDVTNADYAIIGAPNKGNVIFNNGYETDFFPGLPNTGPWNGCGIVMRSGASFCTIQGNFIGTNYVQDSIAGNEYCGVIVQNNCKNNLIGGEGVGEGNVIAYNELAVRISNTSSFCQIQQNSMYCNEEGIKLLGNGNQFQPAPIVDSVFVDVLYGKGIPGDFIEVFINDTTGCASVECQGKTFLGTVVVDADSLWSLNAPYPSGENVYGGTIITATATDSMQNTSPFSNCLSVAITCNTFVIEIENLQNATCGSINGSFEVIANGGFEPYVYDFGNGPTSETILDSLAAGIYYVTATDISGCMKMDTIEILEINAPVLSATEIINENCGQENGSITLSVLGGTPPFLYDIGNGPQTDSIFENLSAGVYPIILTDSTGCQDSIEITLENIEGPILAVANVVNENCNMEDGSFTVIPFGGIPPFQYDIGNGSTGNPNFTGLSNGFYTVVVTDNFGCSNSISVVIFDAPPIIAFGTNIMNATCGLTNGSFEVSVIGGLAPYTFDIGNGVTSNNTFTNLSEGDYQVTITDLAGCTANIIVTIESSDSPTFSIINIIEEDCGQVNGSFEISASGGTSPYTYDIGAGATSNPIFSNLNSGVYNIILTDVNGCSSSQVFTLGESGISLIVDEVINATCGVNNGSITVSSVGGTSPILYDIGNGVTTNPVFENLASGTYSITVTDVTGCSDDETVIVLSTGGMTFSIINIMNENCGQTDGSFEVSPSSGTAPFTYDIGNGITTNPIFTNLNSGIYTVVVTDSEGCNASQVFTLGENEVVLNIDNITNATCGLENGSITVSTTGGTAPFIFNLGNGATTNPVFENLAGGTYSVTVTDGNGCSNDQTVNVLSTQGVSFSIINVMNENCGQDDGSFEVSTSSGTAPFTYDIGNGATSNPIFTNLNSGIYTVIVTDAEGCSASQVVTLGENQVVLNIDDITNETCDLENGSITVSTTGGTAPFIFNLGNVATINPVFENLAGGTYSITVTDGNGCSDNQTVNVLSTQGVNFSIINVMNENCGQDDGSFEISTSSGTAPFTYDIGNGANSNPIFTNLNSGTYTVIVTDAEGCNASQVITLGENEVVLNIDNITNATCGLENGSITVSTTGGTAPFSYNLGNGATTNPVFENLAGGTYSITVTDGNGCSADQTVNILSSGGVTFSIINIMNENCGQTDGSFEVSPSTGTVPFTYNIGNGATSNPIFTNLNSGTYTVIVTDAEGCIASQVITLGENDVMLNIDNITNATCGLENGSITVSTTGGTSPFIFNLGNGVTINPVFENLAGGTYTITVTDGNGCNTDQSVAILGTGAPSFSIINVVNENCGQTNGSFEISATGGTTPYTYNIGAGTTTTPIFTNLNASVYNIIVTDATGCTTSQVFNLPENNITLNIDSIQNTNCGLSDGSITVSTTGGTSPFLFDIGNGNTSNSVFENLSSGVYNITLTDSNGCSDVQSATVGSSSLISISFTDVQPETCGQMDGGFTVNAIGGVAPYTFDIGNGVTNNNIFTNLSIGNYSVTVTDDNGCQEIDDITIEGANSPSLLLGEVFSETCNQMNGAISMIGSGGEMPYTYDFGNGPSSSNVALNLSAGIYNVTISDINGCTGELEVTLLNVGSAANAGYVYNNNALTVNFTNTSTDASSYAWDFGDGTSSTEIDPSHTYASSGVFEVCLTVSNSCSNDTFCEMITVNLPENVVFDLSEISGEAGDTVYLGVAVENFENMTSFQKSIQMMDTTVAQFIGVSSLNLVDLSMNDFTISNNTITADWMTNSSAGQTVNDGTIIYELAIKLLFKIDCSQVKIDDNPLPITAMQNVNGTNLNVNVDVFGGEVCVTNGMGNTVEIAGLIFKENGQTVANVDVTCLTAPNPIYITNSTGVYEFLDLPQGGDYTVTPYKNDAPENGLTALDLGLIQQHILGTTLLNSPYKIIAADANNSSSISALDLVAIQNVILGNSTSFPNNTSWRFVPEDYVFPDPMNPFSPSFPEEITLFSLGVDSLTENFIAIKIGDVNLNSTPSLTNDPTENLVFLMDYELVPGGEYLLIDFKLKKHNQIGEELEQLLAWQMDLGFDPSQLIFEKIENISLPNFNENNVGIRFLENGILPLVWVNPLAGIEHETSLRDETLFRLKFKVKNGFKFNGNFLSIKKDRIENIAIRSGQLLEVSILLEKNKNSEIEESKWKVIPNYPNPFNEFTTIEFHLPQSENITFSVFDMQGKLVYQLKDFFGKGKNEIRIDEANLPNLGLYHYQLQTAKNQSSGKMILMK